MPVSTEPNKMLCKDQWKVGSQKGKAMDSKALTSKLRNSNRLISNANKECQFIQCTEIMYQMIPELLDIPDKYSNLALMSLLSVLHKGMVKTPL